MTNSLASYLVKYVEAMFKDVAYAYTHESDWKRDKTRLQHELEINGSRVLTIDLPAIGKVLDKSLDEGVVQYQKLLGLPYSSLGTHGFPKLFGNLWNNVFKPLDGKLRESPCIDTISVLRQLYSSGKKLKLECQPKGVYDEVRNFFAIEQQIRASTFRWDEDYVDFGKDDVSFADIVNLTDRSNFWLPFVEARNPQGGYDATLRDNPADDEGWLTALQHVCDRIAIQFGDLHIERSTELPKHGPGIVSNQQKGVSKYLFAEWPDKLQATFPYDYYALSSLARIESHSDFLEGVSKKESPSKLIAVPKTLTKPRLIAAEPNQHMWIQQLVRNQLESRLEDTQLSRCIRFRSQDRNRSFALKASVDGSHATIDLSSASDRLSCYVVERAFRKNLTILERLHAARTRYIVNALDKKSPAYSRLKKFAAQGSAVTFPVQSIVYGCVAVTAELLTRNLAINSKNIDKVVTQVSVFGDDIIVTKDSMSVLVLLLEMLGLKVNVDKSFGTGKFRESCGIDAFGGYDVTPAYLISPNTRVSLNGAPSLLEVANNFWRRGLWHTSKCIESTMEFSGKLIPTIAPSSGLLGLMSFCGSNFSHLAKGWDVNLQRPTYRVVRITTKQRIIETEWTHRLFQWFTEKPQPDTLWESGTRAAAVVTARPGWSSLDT